MYASQSSNVFYNLSNKKLIAVHNLWYYTWCACIIIHTHGNGLSFSNFTIRKHNYVEVQVQFDAIIFISTLM